MHCSVNLNVELVFGSTHFLDLVSAKNFLVGVHDVVVLVLEDLVLSGKILNKVSSWVL